MDSPHKEHYLADFERFDRESTLSGPAWLRRIRRAAIERFAELGFPTTRHEEWKYTNVEPIASRLFERANGSSPLLSTEQVLSRSYGDSALNRLVFVNGRYSAPLSRIKPHTASVEAMSLAEALKTRAGRLEPHLARHARYEDQAFVALNTAFAQDGAFIYVPRGQVLSEPLYLVFVSADHEKPVACYPRNLIVLDPESEARVVESYVGLSSAAYFTNPVSEIILSDGARLDYYRLQQEGETGFHVGALEVSLSQDCGFTSHSLVLDGGLVRNDLHVVLRGKGGECVLNGLYMVDENQHVDNHTYIEHVASHAISRELYKGVLGGRARGVFNGKIFVHKAAQKSDARQTNKNLLLSPNAVVNTKPQLEIYADDVKCTHGSTIGQLDRDALFYLRSRGIDLETAQNLLTYAFVSELVDRIQVGSIRTSLSNDLLSRFTESSTSP
jgi:Fe-S cluster assembly protein SufD